MRWWKLASLTNKATIMWEQLGITSPDWAQLGQLSVRLIVACGLAAILGLEREVRGRQAGLRTHMLVALGSALFTAIPLQSGAAGVGEIVKGITAGVGFLGAGAILKQESEKRISGITTAAGIWATAAIGFAAGAGFLGSAIVATILAWLILYPLDGVAEPLRDDNPPAEESKPKQHA
jgi:putative Mg2+ transporter-C (MgtC) family protein